MIQSPYTITLTPAGGPAIELVAAGGWLAQLPDFSASQDLFETDGIMLAHGFFRPLGAVAVSIQLAVEREHADLLEALEAFLDASGIGAGDLLQISGALTFIPDDGSAPDTFTDAVVSLVTPDLPSGPSSTTIRDFSIKTSLPL